MECLLCFFPSQNPCDLLSNMQPPKWSRSVTSEHMDGRQADGQAGRPQRRRLSNSRNSPADELCRNRGAPLAGMGRRMGRWTAMCRCTLPGKAMSQRHVRRGVATSKWPQTRGERGREAEDVTHTLTAKSWRNGCTIAVYKVFCFYRLPDNYSFPELGFTDKALYMPRFMAEWQVEFCPLKMDLSYQFVMHHPYFAFRHINRKLCLSQQTLTYKIITVLKF